MHLRDTPDEAAFRAELRTWLAETVPQLPPEPDEADFPARRAHEALWQKKLFDAGYAGINWPVEGGGKGASPSEHLIYLEEQSAAKAPEVSVGFVGQMHAGPTLIAEGTPEQQAHHLRGILTGEHVWCQGFSEPEAGSDLASLRTKAFRDGDHYVVTGQKIWTSNAMVADYCELLVRTDPDVPKHKGITWLIMPMDLPGIEVRPLVTVHGSAEFAELFLDEVRIPITNRVGDENDGWRVANVTLSFERGTGFVGEMLDTTNMIRDLVDLAQRIPKGSGTAWDDPGIRRDLGQLAAELDALWAYTKRNVSAGAKGGLPMGSGSAFKLSYAGVVQRLGDLALRILDRSSLAMDDVDGLPTAAQVHSRLHAFAVSLGGGTSQIQQNIIAERVLGLPAGALMDLDRNDDQLALQEMISRFAADRFDIDSVRAFGEPGGFDRAAWAELAELGTFGIALGEDAGGVGLGTIEAVLVHESLGAGLVPGPLVAATLAAGLVDGVVDGTVVPALVERPAHGPIVVEHLRDADVLLVLDADGIASVDAASVGGTLLPHPTDPITPVTVLDDLPTGERIAGPDVATAWRRTGSVLASSQLVGLSEAATSVAVEYAKERQQFGKPIGSFQGLKHLLADSYMRTEVARSAVWSAGVTIDEPEVGDIDRAVAAARIMAARAATENAKTGVQVHGGMGFTWEVVAHLYLKRAWVLETQFGNPDDAAELVAATVAG